MSMWRFQKRSVLKMPMTKQVTAVPARGVVETGRNDDLTDMQSQSRGDEGRVKITGLPQLSQASTAPFQISSLPFQRLSEDSSLNGPVAYWVLRQLPGLNAQ